MPRAATFVFLNDLKEDECKIAGIQAKRSISSLGKAADIMPSVMIKALETGRVVAVVRRDKWR
jgi:hypothetical protein